MVQSFSVSVLKYTVLFAHPIMSKRSNMFAKHFVSFCSEDNGTFPKHRDLRENAIYNDFVYKS